MDVFGVDTFFDELKAVALPKVDVPLLLSSPSMGRKPVLGVGMHRWILLGQSLHRKPRLCKEVIHFVPHFETLKTDAWPDDGMKMGGFCVVSGFQYVDVALNDAFQRAFPSCMNRRDGHRGVVPKEDGDAVCRTYADADVFKVGGEGINTVERQCLFQRVLTDEVLVDDDGFSAMRLMKRQEKAGNRDVNTTISCRGEGGDRGRSGVDVHGSKGVTLRTRNLPDLQFHPRQSTRCLPQ